MSEKDTINQKRTVTMIDPDGGWKYGFPKPLPEHVQGDITQWLIQEGYPKFWVDYWERSIGHVPCRWFEQQID